MSINVGTLFAYDYEKLKISIPCYYPYVDSITIAKDYKNRTWAGNLYEVDYQFFVWLKEYDHEKKITMYEDDFYIPELTTTQNETRERKMLASMMPKSNWYIQIDADEYFLHFDKFATYLKKKEHVLINNPNQLVQVMVWWINIFKKEDGYYLYVKKTNNDHMSCAPIAVSHPDKFINARQTEYCSTQIVYTSFQMVHQIYARDINELRQKYANWGHNKDFNVNQYIDMWQSINIKNFEKFKNIHPIIPSSWKELGIVKSNNIQELIQAFQQFDNIFFNRTLNAYRNFKHSIKFCNSGFLIND